MIKRHRKGSVRVVVVLSDIHAGSTQAILPPDFRTLEDTRVRLSRVQEWLWKCWTDLTTDWLPGVVGSDEWALVLNGDLIEGAHHGCKQIISPDTNDHANAAIELLQPLAVKAAQTFVVLGTEVHVNNAEHSIGRALGATPDPNTNNHAWGQLSLTVGGTLCRFRHHISTALRPWTESSGLGIALANEQLEAVTNGEPIPLVLGCAHRHVYGEARRARGMCFVTPPWEQLTRYGQKVAGASRTKPGAVALDWRGVKDGEIPTTRPQTYSLPQMAGVNL